MASACLQPPIFIYRSNRSSLVSYSSGGNPMGSLSCACDSREGPAPMQEPSTAAVDRWLNEKLQMLYGPVLSEPIPEQLAQMIADHRRAEGDR